MSGISLNLRHEALLPSDFSLAKVANEVDGECIQAFSKLSDYHQLKKILLITLIITYFSLQQ